jgi:hypothetical protein
MDSQSNLTQRLTAELAAFTAQLDGVSPTKLTLVNVAIAAFVGVAHGGALALVLSERVSVFDADGVKSLATVTLPLAALILVSSVAAAFHRRLLEDVLKLHAAVLLVGAVAAMGEVAWVVVNGFPSESVTWTPGLFTALMTYAFYLFRRMWLSPWTCRSYAAMNLHWLAAPVALAIELAVIVRLFLRTWEHFSNF